MADVILTFGGGLNARRRIFDINIDECAPPSINFDLDPQYRSLVRRKPFDLIATVPNGATVKGFAQLIKRDGSVSTLVQAGANVYSWNGGTTFTLVGTVDSSSRLRGPREHNFPLDSWVIVTDLEKLTTVKKWDGATFTDLAHDLGSDLFAKYCRIAGHRAFFANVKTTTDTPHVLLASKVDDSEVLSDSETPTSALGEDAPFFLTTPDLKSINGMEEAFGEILFSTERGQLLRLVGEDSFDFEINSFHTGSASVGEESMKNVGNDVIMGLAGRIESVSATLEFGDVETNDISRDIAPLIEDVTSWTLEYDRRRQLLFCFPNTESAIYVLHKKVLDENALVPRLDAVSPWSKWTTSHDMQFNPSVIMQLIDPLSGQDAVYFGDSSGRVFKFDGSGGQDGGTGDITVTRTSGLIATLSGNAFDIEGWLSYTKRFAGTVKIKILGGGVAVYDQSIDIKIPAGEAVAVYSGSSFYSQAARYGSAFSGRISQRDWAAAGHSSHFQVQVEYTGATDINIEEIGIRFKETKT